jgi:hypothetical protein
VTIPDVTGFTLISKGTKFKSRDEPLALEYRPLEYRL